jgi:mono/diheme cytochrome c family protein
MMRLLALSLAASAVAVACASGPPKPADPALVRGWEVYQQKHCSACHRIGDDGGGTGGPPLTHLGSAAAARTAGLSAEDYVRESIFDPGAYVVPGYPDTMPRGQARDLSPDDVDALVRYLLSLK